MISVSMIVKNESSCLKDCLKSIQGLYDELVIVDTGSIDNTIEIAKSYTDKVYSGKKYKWTDDFAFHRNQSLDLCSKDWVYIIDADETLAKDSVKQLRDTVNNVNDKDIDVVYVRLIPETRPDNYTNSIRLFRRGNIRWKGKAHNYLSGYDKTKSVRTDIKHFYGYSASHRLDPDRTFRILNKAVSENPALTRERYYLAKEYAWREDHKTAVKHFDLYFANNPTYKREIADTYLQRARSLEKLGNITEAINSLKKAVDINPEFKEAFYFLYDLSKDKKYLEKAKKATNDNVLFIRS